MKPNLKTLCLLAVWVFLSEPGFAGDILQRQIHLSPWLKSQAPFASVSVKNAYFHQSSDFTQGLLVYRGEIYESTGLHGQSKLMRKDIGTGKTLQEIGLPREFFGEGIALFQDKIYVLTWRNETVIIYRASSLKEIGRLKYRGEGWGLTSDGRHLLKTNGTATISFHDPYSFKTVREITVKDGDTPIGQLNEIEFIQGEIWANIFTEDWMVRISPKNGKVLGWIDLSGLRSYLPRGAQVDVLNGIAWDEKTNRIFVTGKYWPKLFEIEIVK